MKNSFTILFLLICTSIFSQKTIPNVSLTSLNGKTVSIENEISKDKVTVLSFWATWCVPCINELDAISEVYQDWQDETEIEIIAISIDDSRTQKRVKPLINGKDWNYKVLIDKNQELKRALNISVIPHVIVLKGSKILYRHTGYSPGAEEELYKKIKEFSK
ncbi:MAG: TlpA disulfide reductase family protein [Polaribacter sp.]|uniref:TlpA family protein disulfide reductase n=1 Tax=Polaribacter sp. TaxID=1920175 RepID=UPI002F352A69